jgi:hypothetical protein
MHLHLSRIDHLHRAAWAWDQLNKSSEDLRFIPEVDDFLNQSMD